jgi:fatty-acyl-CoA synthase
MYKEEGEKSLKFAFSTLACPRWSIEQIVEDAVRLGYGGVELRLLDGEVIDPVKDAIKVAQAVKLCRARGLDVCALDTSCRFNISDPQERAQQEADLENWIRLAQDVQVPLLRVFGGPGQRGISPPPDADEADVWVAESLGQVVPQAERAGVTIVIETHDAFSSAQRVAKVLREVDSTNVAALWDSHHPYRVGESVEEVIAALAGHIAHVHVKDARRKAPGSSEWQLVLMGEGEVPVREQLIALKEYGYDGYISVEWEKKWHPEIAEPEVALPQHLAWLKNLSLR